MFDYLLSPEQLKIRDELRDLVKWVPRQMILDMDADKIRFPKEFLREAGRRNLLEKFITESCQRVVHNSMQVVGGIGYTNVLPIERIHRDLRLASIWTGTSEVMSMMIAQEWYRESLQNRGKLPRNFEADAQEAGAADEIIYE